MFDRYSISLKEQTRAAMRRQADYLKAQREAATRKVEPLRQAQ